MKKFITFNLFISALIILNGCGAISTFNASGKDFKDRNNDNYNYENVVITKTSRSDVDKEVNNFALMAHFSNVVYRKDLGPKLTDSMGCDYDSQDIQYGMPKSNSSEWRRLPAWSNKGEGIATCISKNGLHFETYAHFQNGPNNAPDQVVIAIRGTENGTLQDMFENWTANFSAAFGFEPSEYKSIRNYAKILITGLVDTYGANLEIYTTGHSLGGGMAQELAFAFKKISAAYVFDTSPVTNWTAMVFDGLIENHDPNIYRVYEHHEFLSYARFFSDRFTGKHVNRSDYEFFFTKTNPIKEHSMAIIACHLANKMTSDDEKFNYSKDYAKSTLKDHRLCPAEILSN